MNSFEIKYNGNLRTSAKHLESGSIISTDAPKDNHGLGETFSPTDILCSSLASCILTIMAIAVEKKDIDITDTTAIVKKTMTNTIIHRIIQDFHPARYSNISYYKTNETFPYKIQFHLQMTGTVITLQHNCLHER